MPSRKQRPRAAGPADAPRGVRTERRAGRLPSGTDACLRPRLNLENTGTNSYGQPGRADADSDAPDAWVAGTGTGTVIALLDTGFDTDHPDIFASEDQGPTPVEMLLVGLAGCLSAGVAAVAQHRGIQLHAVSASVEADMDIQGILGIADDVRNGFSAVRVHFEVDADATSEEIAALVAQSQKRSAVFDTLTNPTDVHVTARKVAP